MAALAAAALAQNPTEPAPAPERAGLIYSGKPLALASRCRIEDMSAQGLSCDAEEPCPVFLELADVEALGVKLFLSGNLHTASATLESILLVSDDGGKTWTEAADRVALASLDSIQFLDFENGWVSGQSVLALPRDPFLMITGDGGKTWRRRPLYGETRPGAIDAFWFESRTAGKLLVDRGQIGDDGMRYEFYESQTGGDSWTLRQVDSKPLNIKRPAAAPSDWRLRADASLKAYRVERQQAGKWVTVSSFGIAAGECKAPSREPAAEPPPEAPPPPETPAKPAPAKRPPKSPSLRR